MCQNDARGGGHKNNSSSKKESIYGEERQRKKCRPVQSILPKEFNSLML